MVPILRGLTQGQRISTETVGHVLGAPFPFGLLFRLKATARSVGGSNGPVPPGSIRPLALQLEAAIHTLLDIKPGNIPWCPQLTQLKLCDVGLSEPFAGVVENQGSASTPRSHTGLLSCGM